MPPVSALSHRRSAEDLRSSMTPAARLLFGFGFIWASALICIHGLQCYGCNVLYGQKYVDVGCASPEVITCTHSHKGFKHRFCIRTESTALGMVLTSGCATSRHCQQQELPGLRIHCCDSDLCNSAPCCPTLAPPFTLLLVCFILSV